MGNEAELPTTDDELQVIDEVTTNLRERLAQLTAKHATRWFVTEQLEGVTGDIPGPNQSEQIVSDDDAITS